jgi:hypothetical protein
VSLRSGVALVREGRDVLRETDRRLVDVVT